MKKFKYLVDIGGSFYIRAESLKEANKIAKTMVKEAPTTLRLEVSEVIPCTREGCK